MHPLVVKFPIVLLLFVAQHGGLAKPTGTAARLDYAQLPNIAVSVSLLLTLCACPWTRIAFTYSVRKPPRCVRLALDVWMTVYLVDVLLRMLWLPLLELTYRCLQMAAGRTAVWARGPLWWQVRLLQPATVWMRRDAMGWARVGLAAIAVWVMLVVTGALATAGRWYVRQFGREPGDHGDAVDGVRLSRVPVVATQVKVETQPVAAEAAAAAAPVRKGRPRGRASRSRTRAERRS